VNLTVSKFKIAALLGTTALLTTLGTLAVHAGEAMPQMAQAPEEIPENVLITGSLIRGTAAVGVPVTNLSPQDFAVTGAVTTGDLFRDFPAANVSQSGSATLGGGHTERETRVNLRGLDATGPRSLLMVDGMRYPPQADGICAIDPSIIPSIALDHVDILADGASATYGSDAIAGVINLILKRNYDGAQTQLGFSSASSGRLHYQADQLWGRTWDGGQITLSFEWYDDSKVKGTAHSNFTLNYIPWGLDNRSPLGSSTPGTISTGAVTLPGPTSAPVQCLNCYAIPKGSGGNFASSLNNGVGPLTAAQNPNLLSWATISSPAYSGANGVQNVVDPDKLGWEDAPQTRVGEVMTLDQRLTKDISFFGEAFYSNRSGFILNEPTATPTANAALAAIAVPTWNPYYPAGAPNNLRVSYDIGIEHPPITDFHELAERYAMGLNIELPAEWHGKIYYSESRDTSFRNAPGSVNVFGVSAALGWTIQPVAAAGTGPSFGTWTKPASVPYLNLFCDPHQFQCNSPTTLKYVASDAITHESYSVNEKGLVFDGPLFDLPGGPVKAAIGATYISDSVSFLRQNASAAPNLLVTPTLDVEPYGVWATFAQLNVPIFGDNNAMPFFRRLEFELSWRHDQYSGTLTGATSNPKVGVTWMLSEDAGLSLKGSYGTSFRFANAGEYAAGFSTAIVGLNTPAAFQFAPATVSSLNCVGGAPPAGSGAAKVFSSGLFACGSSPFGLSLGGAPSSLLRPDVPGTTTPALAESLVLNPEQSTNWSGGFDFAPTKFLPGLDLQVTYYDIKITNLLQANQTHTNTTTFNSPGEGYHYIVPSDLHLLDPACNLAANAKPTLCPEFEAMVQGILTNNLNSAVSTAAATSVYFIDDGGTVNTGWRKVQGIDFSGSYDWDMGNIGAFNTGAVGTYYLHDITLTVPGATPLDIYHTTLSVTNYVESGVPQLPYFRYRARLGWSNGPWSVTGFMNYISHYYTTQSSPPNVNSSICVAAGSSLGGGTFPCLLQNYTGLEPPQYTFDLSLGYDTGDDPANDYLKHIGISFVVRDILDKHAAFGYFPFSAQVVGTAYDRIKDNEGRIISLLLTKTW
jgi:iron complex outermembrane receptor protein